MLSKIEWMPLHHFFQYTCCSDMFLRYQNVGNYLLFDLFLIAYSQKLNMQIELDESTTEVTPVTISYIHTPDLGHQMVTVMNDLLPSPLCNVNWPSHSAISKFNHENPWSRSCVVRGQGHV